MTIAAVGQFCATSSIIANTSVCQNLTRQAARLGAKMIFLPEASDFIASSSAESLSLTNSLSTSLFLKDISETAREESIWISVGVHESSPNDPKHIFNTHVIIDQEGALLQAYHKIHLFDVDIKNGPRLLESNTTIKGETIGSPVQTPVGWLGQQTCYDLRFAEQAITLRTRGAEILAYPSAFTVRTGMAHWEPLLRARAIETQTYVIAAAQIGQHNEKRTSYGNAMIVDPWGTVLSCCSDNTNPSIAIADIDLDYLKRIRIEMPVMSHRRTDLYPKLH